MSFYKMIAIDIDGTLLNSKNELTQRTIDILKEASERGVYIVLTSGRISTNVKNFCNKIGANQYLIAENGASVINLQTNEIEYSKYIPKDVVNKVLDICEENSIYYMVYTQKELIVKNIKYMSLFFYKQNFNPNARIKQVVAGRDYIQMSIMIMETKKEFEIKYSYADISAAGANKWTAIEYLANKLGIQKEEIIAIGDNINDLHMIHNAGLGVAMENGCPLVRKVANVVAPSNDIDGVAQIVEKYVLRWRLFLKRQK